MRQILFLFSAIGLFFSPSFAQKKLIKIEGATQGSSYHISYYDDQDRDLEEGVNQILRDFDKSVSTYDPNSIISRVNRAEKNVVVDKYFKDCFLKAMEVSKNTDGAFDATVGPLVNAWGFGPGKKLKMNQRIIDSLLKFVGYNLVELKGDSVIKKDPRVYLDFNAFAPGYSVDVVSKFLESKGITSYIVEIGGEVFARNKKDDGDYWKVGIEKPIDNPGSSNPLKAIAKLENKSIATSGNYRKFYLEDGKRYSHHIDPKTGYPTKNNLLSVSVLANDCVSADAYATGILVMGMEKALIFLNNHPEFEVYLIYSDDKGNYKVYESRGLKKYISDAK